MNHYTVYVHTTPSGKVYVGITNDTKRRWSASGGRYRHNPHFWRAILKYGWDNIRHEILLDNLTCEEAKNQERRFIEKWMAADPERGYNLTLGGDGCLGRKVSDETRVKISEGNRGKVISQEQREKISRSMRGKSHPVDAKTREKISLSKKGKWTGGRGAEGKKVLCVETGLVYENARIAAQELGLCYSGIYRCVQGERATCGGYRWRHAV